MKRLESFFVGLLVIAAAVVAASAFVVLDADPDPPHAAPRAGAIGPPSLSAVGGGSPADIEAWIKGVRDGEWYEGVEAARLEAARAAASVRVATPGAQPSGASGCGDDWDCFRECTIDHESRTSGEYGAVSPGGTYRGAFQFLASTWRSVAVNAGYGEWADVPVDQVPVAVQDAVARFLWEHSGTRPWGGRCG